MDPVFILAAFLSGVAALLLRLPPLVGFLVAGFALNALGYEKRLYWTPSPTSA